MSNQSPIAVFDLGGVIVRICQSWQEAIQVAGLQSKLLTEPTVPLIDFPPFNAFQATELPEADYLKALADFVGVPEEKAIDIHVGILREPYPRIDEVIDELEAQSIETGCLSNTNAAHWYAMTQTAPFAPVARLKYRAGSHELGCAKPDLRAFQAYAERFGILGRRVVYFDDALKNVDAAREFGWDAYAIDPWGDPAAQIQEILADSVFSKMTS